MAQAGVEADVRRGGYQRLWLPPYGMKRFA